MTASLVVLLALQVGTPPLDVTARVDRGRIVLGDEIGLTVRARARTAEPVSLELPVGFCLATHHGFGPEELAGNLIPELFVDIGKSALEGVTAQRNSFLLES